MPWAARRLDFPERRITHKNIRQIEIRPVKSIERFHAKLQIHALTELRIFQHGQIDSRESRPIQNIPAGVPKASVARDHEGRCIEPAVRPRIRESRIPDYVWPVVSAE